jgi:hypothetical protein
MDRESEDATEREVVEDLRLAIEDVNEVPPPPPPPPPPPVDCLPPPYLSRGVDPVGLKDSRREGIDGSMEGIAFASTLAVVVEDEDNDAAELAKAEVGACADADADAVAAGTDCADEKEDIDGEVAGAVGGATAVLAA